MNSSDNENSDQSLGEDSGAEGIDDEEVLRRDTAHSYSLGLDSLAGGDLAIDNGILDFNLEIYENSIDSFESAVESFERAEGQFSDAIDLTYEIREPEAREICETGESTAITLQNAAERYKSAALYSKDGESAEQINNRIGQAEEYEFKAEQSPPRDLSVLGNLLDVDTEDMGIDWFGDDES